MEIAFMLFVCHKLHDESRASHTHALKDVPRVITNVTDFAQRLLYHMNLLIRHRIVSAPRYKNITFINTFWTTLYFSRNTFIDTQCFIEYTNIGNNQDIKEEDSIVVSGSNFFNRIFLNSMLWFLFQVWLIYSQPTGRLYSVNINILHVGNLGRTSTV